MFTWKTLTGKFTQMTAGGSFGNLTASWRKQQPPSEHEKIYINPAPGQPLHSTAQLLISEHVADRGRLVFTPLETVPEMGNTFAQLRRNIIKRFQAGRADPGPTPQR